MGVLPTYKPMACFLRSRHMILALPLIWIAFNLSGHGFRSEPEPQGSH